jgi:tRNA A-37 threonylcarbamoyl transferase component Bud32
MQLLTERINKKIYRDGDRVIKLFDEEFSKADVLNEALNQARVEETNIKIPRLQEVTKMNGKWAIVLDYIEGKTMKDLMIENPDGMEGYLNLFVDLQMETHKQKSGLLGKHKDKMHRKIRETKLDSGTKFNLASRLEGMPTQTKVCHGDFTPSNIIISNDGAYIIDWSHATQGDSSADVARSYLLFNLKGEKEIADRYLDLFCQKSSTEKKHIQNWLPIVAASQSVKGNEGEFELLSRWINVIESQG